MDVKTFLSQHRTRCGVETSSKKRALEILSQTISEDQPTLDANEIFQNLIAREKLGSTGLGQGIAIPHCRLSNCASTVGALITLASPIDFEAIDGKPVDILFALVVPEEAHEAHLQTLSAIAERLNQSDFLKQLRHSDSAEKLFAAATSQDTPQPQ